MCTLVANSSCDDACAARRSPEGLPWLLLAILGPVGSEACAMASPSVGPPKSSSPSLDEREEGRPPGTIRSRAAKSSTTSSSTGSGVPRGVKSPSTAGVVDSKRVRERKLRSVDMSDNRVIGFFFRLGSNDTPGSPG
ncbi:hypothetical protein BDZ97DRAFT_1804732 [Flammula alnicola]|nr:hypothetical protein BDZ97DRAFT_1804732 [Flammula alnicola]